ncbi:glutathione S-transferase family protein [Sporobolomyces salmoneus]|uniref:glutathione S-transferase family protein n=1 Tax=Sporobolomyces salmoneus TaxID=183962 RepID=UPI0031708A33
MPDHVEPPHATGLAAKTVEKHQAENSLVFHSGWFCPFVQRVWIALEERGIPYQYNEINPYKKEPHFLKINPKGLVPALEHDGKALYESLVLLEYLEDAFPQNPLRSSDHYENGRVRLAAAQVSNVLVPAYYKLLQAQGEEAQKEAKEGFVKAFKDVEENWFVKGQGEWARGEKFGILDAVIAPWIVRLDVLIDHRNFKVEELGKDLEAYVERILDRDSIKATVSDKEAYTQIYQRYLTNTAESEVAKATRGGTWLK